MKFLSYSNDLERVTEIQSEITAEEALYVLARVLLGEDYGDLDDPFSGPEIIRFITEDILRNYKPKKFITKRRGV